MVTALVRSTVVALEAAVIDLVPAIRTENVVERADASAHRLMVRLLARAEVSRGTEGAPAAAKAQAKDD